jgi:hypothetical protein
LIVAGFIIKGEMILLSSRTKAMNTLIFQVLILLLATLGHLKPIKKTTNCAHQKAKAITIFTFQVLIKMYSCIKKFDIFFVSELKSTRPYASIKDVQASGEAFSPQNIQHFKT